MISSSGTTGAEATTLSPVRAPNPDTFPRPYASAPDVALMQPGALRFARHRRAERQGQAALERVKRHFDQEKVFEALAGFYFQAMSEHPDTAHLAQRLKPTA